MQYAAELRFTNWFHLNSKTRLSSYKVTLLVAMLKLVRVLAEIKGQERSGSMGKGPYGVDAVFVKNKRSTGLLRW